MGRAAAKIARWLSFKKAEPKKADPVVTRPKRLKGAKSPRRRRKKGNECVDSPASVAKTYGEKTQAVNDVDAEEKMRGVNVETGSKVDAVSTDNVALNMEDWAPLGVHALIVKALKSLGFRSPTSIQREVVPLAIHERCDIVGAAETVSIHAICSIFSMAVTFSYSLGFGKDSGLCHTDPPSYSYPLSHTSCRSKAEEEEERGGGRGHCGPQLCCMWGQGKEVWGQGG